MKIALAQMSMTADIAENLKKSLAYCDEAAGCDLLFFPEIQLSPFFPQYEKKNVDAYAMGEDAEALRLLMTSTLPVKTVAGRVGYNSLSSFSKQFSERYGIEPSGFR